MAMAPEYLAEVQIEDALRSIGFTEDSYGGLGWECGGLFISAGRGWGGWMLNVQRATSRTLTDYEKVLPDVGVKGRYFAEIYNIWREQFPYGVTPLQLIPGQDYIDYQTVLKRLMPPTPSIKIGKVWMSAIVTRVRESAKREDPEVDFPIRMYFENEQIFFDVIGKVIRLPASVNWLGSVTFSMRDFLGACKRFNHDPVILEYSNSRLRICNRTIEARWVES